MLSSAPAAQYEEVCKQDDDQEWESEDCQDLYFVHEREPVKAIPFIARYSSRWRYAETDLTLLGDVFVLINRVFGFIESAPKMCREFRDDFSGAECIDLFYSVGVVYRFQKILHV